MALPAFIAGRPELTADQVPVWDAFWLLSTCRSTGFSVGPIPWTAINDYGLRYEMTLEEFESFSFLIRRMDSVWLEFASHGRGEDTPSKA